MDSDASASKKRKQYYLEFDGKKFSSMILLKNYDNTNAKGTTISSLRSHIYRSSDKYKEGDKVVLRSDKLSKGTFGLHCAQWAQTISNASITVHSFFRNFTDLHLRGIWFHSNRYLFDDFCNGYQTRKPKVTQICEEYLQYAHAVKFCSLPTKILDFLLTILPISYYLIS